MASRYLSLISEEEKDNSKRQNPNKNNHAAQLHPPKNLSMVLTEVIRFISGRLVLSNKPKHGLKMSTNLHLQNVGIECEFYKKDMLPNAHYKCSHGLQKKNK